MILGVRVGCQALWGISMPFTRRPSFCSFARRFSSRFLLIGFLETILGITISSPMAAPHGLPNRQLAWRGRPSGERLVGGGGEGSLGRGAAPPRGSEALPRKSQTTGAGRGAPPFAPPTINPRNPRLYPRP